MPCLVLALARWEALAAVPFIRWRLAFWMDVTCRKYGVWCFDPGIPQLLGLNQLNSIASVDHNRLSHSRSLQECSSCVLSPKGIRAYYIALSTTHFLIGVERKWGPGWAWCDSNGADASCILTSFEYLKKRWFIPTPIRNTYYIQSRRRRYCGKKRATPWRGESRPTYLASHIISNNPRYTYLGSVHIESIVLIERMIELFVRTWSAFCLIRR
jgi:hypothetical protein